MSPTDSPLTRSEAQQMIANGVREYLDAHLGRTHFGNRSIRPNLLMPIQSDGSEADTNSVPGFDGEHTFFQSLTMLGALTNIKVGSITISNGTGTESFTGVGFKPRLLILFSTIFNASASVMTFSMGASDGATSRAIAIRADATDGQRSKQGSLYAVIHANTSNISANGALQSFDDDGFTIDRVSSNGLDLDFWYIAIG